MKDHDITRQLPLDQTMQSFLGSAATPEAKIRIVQAALESAQGTFWRKELGSWAARMVPVELLVPEEHREWRPLVHEAIVLVVAKLSAGRLAPKIVEQLTLGADTSVEERLLRFIAKVPGLQKIGQVLARNRELHPRLRKALIKLENGIADVPVEEIVAIIQKNLQAQIEAYDIKLESKMLSEASVSAVVGFSWRNPEARRRERGVFKVLKPHISSCYAEDMRILSQLAGYLARKRHVTGVKLGNLIETLTEIRLLLEREVDFPREQATLAGALSEYRGLEGVRVPELIPALSTANITALTFESGKKVTAVESLPKTARMEVAERLARTLLEVPALSREREAIFHADPHAGNLLFDKRSRRLVILDWALTDRLTRKQRRSVLLLVLMMALRDAEGMVKSVEELCQGKADDRGRRDTIQVHVKRLLDKLPITKWPGPVEALRLLDRIAMDGTRFPAALLMFRKAAFTLEGVVQDIAGTPVRLDTLVASHAAARWKDTAASLLLLLSPGDWLRLEWSALTLGSRVSSHALAHTWRLLAALPAHQGPA